MIEVEIKLPVAGVRGTLEKMGFKESAKEKALLRIEQTLNKLGYSLDDTIRTSYLSLLQDQIEEK